MSHNMKVACDNLMMLKISMAWIILRTVIQLMDHRYESRALVLSIKVAFWSFFNTEAIFGLLYSYSQQVPAFSSRGATHHKDARDLYQRRWELLPMNFASKSVIYENPLCSFTCRKAGIWDIILLPLRRKAY